MLTISTPKLLTNAYIFSYDFVLTLYNLVAPNLKVGSVVPHGAPGAGGEWPEYVAPGEGDSRCACPMLNAMANHGILPHDGKNIKFTTITETVRTSFNFAPTFCLFVPQFIAGLLKRDYKTGTCDLADISLHNGIEHDASLTRQDYHFDKDQGKPYLPYITELLDSASGKAKDDSVLLTADDLARFSAKRRADAQAENPEFSLATQHKMFGSSNSSTMLTIFGGRVADLEYFLKEERFPPGWESRILSKKGLTFLTFNRTVFGVEHGTGSEETKLLAERAQAN